MGRDRGVEKECHEAKESITQRRQDMQKGVTARQFGCQALVASESIWNSEASLLGMGVGRGGQGVQAGGGALPRSVTEGQEGVRRVTLQEVRLAEGFLGKGRPEHVCRQWRVKSRKELVAAGDGGHLREEGPSRGRGEGLGPGPSEGLPLERKPELP